MSGIKQNLYQATIYVWGVDPRGSHTKLFGGNQGHSSIKLRFPKDSRGQELINKYCKQIPYNLITEHGSTYFEVYFSPWQKNEQELQQASISKLMSEGFEDGDEEEFEYLKKDQSLIHLKTFTEDKLEARRNKHYDYDKNTSFDYLDIYMQDIKYRKNTDKSKNKHITLSPLSFKSHVDSAEIKVEKILNAIEDYEKEISQLVENIHALQANLHTEKSKNKPFKNINIQQIEEKITNNEKEILFCEQEIVRLYEENKTTLNLDKYIKIGKEPDTMVQLPVVDIHKDSKESGLNLEAMLKQMHKAVTQKDEHKVIYNSNILSLSILEKGMAPNSNLLTKKTSSTKKVYDAAIKMEKELYHTKGIPDLKVAVQKLEWIANTPQPIQTFISVLKQIKLYFNNKLENLTTIIRHPKQYLSKKSVLFNQEKKSEIKQHDETHKKTKQEHHISKTIDHKKQ